MPDTQTFDWLIAALRGTPHSWPSDDGQFATTLSQLLQNNGVSALLYWCLHNTQAWKSLPPDFQNQLKSIVRREAAVEMLREQETIQVLNNLEKAGIQPLLTKGTPLAYSLYPQPHLRSRCDTDVLFPSKESAEHAWNVLKDRGYQRPIVISGEHVSHQFPCYKSLSMGINYALDIHWKISNRQFLASALPYAELANVAQPIPALGAAAKTLSLEHSLLLACVHRIAHKPQGLENRLIWLYDIHLMAEQMSPTQWNTFLHITKEKDLTSVCYNGIEQAAEYFLTTLPDAIHSLGETQSTTELFSIHTGDSRWRTEWSNLRSLQGWRPRLRLLKEHLFPPADYVLHKYQAGNRLLLPWLYLKRIGQGLYKKTR